MQISNNVSIIQFYFYPVNDLTTEISTHVYSSLI